MSAAMLLPITLALAVATPAVRADPPPPIRVWLDHDGRYDQGDRAQVEVRAAQDGYLLVLHVDPEGRLRVLFPVDPGDDQFVRGGKRYQVRSRSGRQSFTVIDVAGNGMIYAAWSPDPYRFDEYVRGDHWDYRVLPDRLPRDPEPELTDLVGRVAPAGRFEYDAVTYTVSEPVAVGGEFVGGPSFGWGGWAGWGWPGWSPYYRPWGGWYGAGWAPWYGGGVSIGIGVGIGWGTTVWGGWYDPWYYHPWGSVWVAPPPAYGWYGGYYGGYYRPAYPVGPVSRPLLRPGSVAGAYGGRWPRDYGFKATRDYFPQGEFPARERALGFSGARTDRDMLLPASMRARGFGGMASAGGGGELPARAQPRGAQGGYAPGGGYTRRPEARPDIGGGRPTGPQGSEPTRRPTRRGYEQGLPGLEGQLPEARSGTGSDAFDRWLQDRGGAQDRARRPTREGGDLGWDRPPRIEPRDEAERWAEPQYRRPSRAGDEGARADGGRDNGRQPGGSRTWAPSRGGTGGTGGRVAPAPRSPQPSRGGAVAPRSGGGGGFGGGARPSGGGGGRRRG